MFKRLSAAVFLCLFFVSCASGAFRPSVTVTFSDLRTISGAVQNLAGGTRDPILTTVVPGAIQNQPLVRLFGPMRPGASGAAVCYVDAEAIARILSVGLSTSANAQKRRDMELERAKHWTVLYPATIGRNDLLRRRPDVSLERGGVLRIPSGKGLTRTMYAVYSPDGAWVAFAGGANLAKATFAAAAGALRVPLGRNLAFIQMDAAGSRALFQSAEYAGGSISIQMTPSGLVLDGYIHKAGAPSRVNALPPGALSFAGIPAAVSLFGVTSSAGGASAVEGVFAPAGPHIASFIRRALVFRPSAGGAQSYYLNLATKAAARNAPPGTRLDRILPEARRRPDLDNVMFCSVANVLRLCIPQIAAALPPGAGLKLQLALPMIRPVRGDGLGFMSWREGNRERFFLRISNDELRGTAILWSALLVQ